MSQNMHSNPELPDVILLILKLHIQVVLQFILVPLDTSVSDIEDCFKKFVKRDDIDIILINQNVRNNKIIKHNLDMGLQHETYIYRAFPNRQLYGWIVQHRAIFCFNLAYFGQKKYCGASWDCLRTLNGSPLDVLWETLPYTFSVVVNIVFGEV